MDTTNRPAEPAVRPNVCPACKSTDVTTGSKTIDRSTYWHCGKCGEVWNAGRRREESHYGFSRSGSRF
jgi:ribosomal protein L37AE/L43A